MQLRIPCGFSIQSNVFIMRCLRARTVEQVQNSNHYPT